MAESTLWAGVPQSGRETDVQTETMPALPTPKVLARKLIEQRDPNVMGTHAYQAHMTASGRLIEVGFRQVGEWKQQNGKPGAVPRTAPQGRVDGRER